MRKFNIYAAAVLVSIWAGASYAGDKAAVWTLDPSLSNISFGSIKNDYTGENHTFSDMSGSVDVHGKVSITVGLASLETMIDIRNERMAEFVFQNAPSATIAAEVDMAELGNLSVNQATVIDTSGALSLLGTDTELDASIFVMRLSEDKVLVTTNGMIMLSTEDTAFNEGIDKLQELASLDSITRVSPVTMRLVFDANS
ncbi:YceI family protein [Phaeobacter sp. C3_T13_0]|uniref:YceI family protein n=1 Tax=Phaeobacter cretensis TaxID=3342641 RepID=UPI0039BD0D65